MDTIITLSQEEMMIAGQVGLMRQIHAISNKLENYRSNVPISVGFGLHICSSMSEFACAKALNLFWEPNVGVLRGGDVGKGLVEVRLRDPSNGPDLAIRPKDNNTSPFVLVHGPPPTFALKGWMYGWEGKEGLWNETRGVFYTPPDQLRPMHTLIPELRQLRVLEAVA